MSEQGPRCGSTDTRTGHPCRNPTASYPPDFAPALCRIHEEKGEVIPALVEANRKRRKFVPGGTPVESTEIFPVSVVSLDAWGKGGKPLPTVRSAICDVCAGWATAVCVVRTGVATGERTDMRISRSTTLCVFACPKHYDEVMDSLTEEYGASTNMYSHDELANEVDRQSRLD